jgi:hypothetical protein
MILCKGLFVRKGDRRAQWNTSCQSVPVRSPSPRPQSLVHLGCDFALSNQRGKPLLGIAPSFFGGLPGLSYLTLTGEHLQGKTYLVEWQETLPVVYHLPLSLDLDERR